MKKQNLRLSLAGQAVAELAIFGSLIMIVFSVLLSYGQRLDGQQQIKMEAFRRAMQKAYQRNSAVSYTFKKDVRFLNLFGGFGQGQGSGLSASASVMWQKGMPGKQGVDDQPSFSYYRINDKMVGVDELGDNDPMLPRRKKLSYGYDDSKNEVKVPVSVYKEEIKKKESYSSSSEKNESDSKIINKKSSNLKETIEVKLTTRFDKSVDTDPKDDKTPAPDYEPADSYNFREGAYYDTDTNRIVYKDLGASTAPTVHRERSWETNK